jgi:hypothetical protein
MEQTMITVEVFDNGVTLRLYDASRKLAGDRWLVALAARATVPVEQNLLAAISPEDLTQIRQALGNELVFEQKRERYFIDDRQKTAVFNQMLESFRSMTCTYLAHPQFPSQFAKKSFRDYLAGKRLKNQMNSGR